MKITIETTPAELAELIFALVDADVEIDDDEGDDENDDDVPRPKFFKSATMTKLDCIKSEVAAYKAMSENEKDTRDQFIIQLLYKILEQVNKTTT